MTTTLEKKMIRDMKAPIVDARRNDNGWTIQALCPWCHTAHKLHAGQGDTKEEIWTALSEQDIRCKKHRWLPYLLQDENDVIGIFVRDYTRPKSGKSKREVQREASAYLAELSGGKPGSEYVHIEFEGHPGNFLQLEFRPFRDGFVLGVDRYSCRRLPENGVEEAWLEEHIHPYSMEWLYTVRKREAMNTCPTGSGCALTNVRTDQALEVMQLWFPKEIEWQAKLLAERPFSALERSVYI